MYSLTRFFLTQPENTGLFSLFNVGKLLKNHEAECISLLGLHGTVLIIPATVRAECELDSFWYPRPDCAENRCR